MTQAGGYAAQGEGSQGAELAALREQVGAQLVQNGVDLQKFGVVDPDRAIPKGNFEWTCGSLLEVAQDFYHGSAAAIQAGNIPLATQYYATASQFQAAFDAQCGPVVS